MTLLTNPAPSLWEALPYLIDEKVGVIKYLQEFPRESGGPDFFHYYALACDISAFGLEKNFANAGGASIHREGAIAKAAGEAVERYCSGFYIKTQLPFSTHENAPFSCINPQEFALYSPGQFSDHTFPYKPFTSQTKIRWTPAHELTTNTTCYVPASMVYLPYSYDVQGGEDPISQPISTGLACHNSLEKAAVSGICEVVERDAFTLTWQAKIAPPKIRLSSLTKVNQEIVERFEVEGYEIFLFALHLDLKIPTVLSVAKGQGPYRPALTLAAATDPQQHQAIKKSLEELAHTLRLALELHSNHLPLQPTEGFTEIKRQHDHVHFFCSHSRLSDADFLFGSNETLNSSELPCLTNENPERELQNLVQLISKLNYKVFLIDLTTPDIMDLGLNVVRILIPGFHPLFLGHRLRALGGTRLYQVPQELGYPGINHHDGDNPVPHPFP